MKVCISAAGTTLEAPLEGRFGRCPHFIFVDSETLAFEAKANPGGVASGGAGIKAAQYVDENKAQVVLTGNVGPNAFETLHAAGITIYTGLSGTVAEALEAFKAGRLTETAGPSVDSKAGM
jgi:predicted Fe-Mo cluster-binding NifX family protein